jgi:pSer/pThr/pTyr-binding forkhead associated (FHA) protein
VGDDGSRIDLDDNYILGREPFEHPDVTGGTARPFLFLDSESEISRAHTRVSVQGGQVTITDLKSANGTYIAVPGASEWQGLVPHTPVVIVPGTRILIGQRTFVFHTP